MLPAFVIIMTINNSCYLYNSLFNNSCSKIPASCRVLVLSIIPHSTDLSLKKRQRMPSANMATEYWQLTRVVLGIFTPFTSSPNFCFFFHPFPSFYSLSLISLFSPLYPPRQLFSHCYPPRHLLWNNITSDKVGYLLPSTYLVIIANSSKSSSIWRKVRQSSTLSSFFRRSLSCAISSMAFLSFTARLTKKCPALHLVLQSRIGRRSVEITVPSLANNSSSS